MGRCRFCDELFTGDCNDSLMTKNIRINKVPIFGMDIFITDDKLELYVDTADSGQEILKKTLKIKYCPMCGRELVKPYKREYVGGSGSRGDQKIYYDEEDNE